MDRMKTKTLSLTVTLMAAALVLIGCNLTRTPPTPTLAPAPTTDPFVTPTFDPGAAFGQFTPTPIIVIGVDGGACQIPAGWVEYTVEPGDSLTLLAEQTDSTPAEIAAGNCRDNQDELFVDEIIYLPRQPVIQLSPV